jgi:hypothetical protein
MDQITKDAATTLLLVNRRAIEVHEEEGRQILQARMHLIAAARRQGMTWDELADILQHPNGHALRMWYRRSGGDA